MKIFVFLFCVIAAVFCAPPKHPKSITGDLKDFILALPLEKIGKLTEDHLENDAQFKAGIKYIQSKEWRTIVKLMRSRPSMKELRMTIKEAGADLEFYEGLWENMIDSYDVVVNLEEEKKSFGSYLSELDQLIPYEKLMEILSLKLETSPAFKNFFDVVVSDKMHQLADKAIKTKEFRVMAEELVLMDVEVYEIIKAIYEILGWTNDEAEFNGLKK